MASSRLTHAAVRQLPAAKPQGCISRSTSAGSCSSPESEHLVKSKDRELTEFDYPLPFTIKGCGPSPIFQDMEYPSPVFVKNTFLDSPVDPASLDGFFQQREIHSCPPGVIGAPPGLDADAASDVQVPELADYEYPAPLLLKNAFSDGPLDAFLLEPCSITSRPGSRLDAVPEQGPASGVEHEHLQTPFPSYVWETPVKDSLPIEALYPSVAAMLKELDIDDSEAAPVMGPPAVPPPPPMWAPTLQPADIVPPPPSAPADEARPLMVVSIADALPEPQLGSAEAPSVGSLGHRFSTCKPCAFMHTKGCSNGVACEFCHLCGPGERKRRQKQKQAMEARQRSLQQQASLTHAFR